MTRELEVYGSFTGEQVETIEATIAGTAKCTTLVADRVELSKKSKAKCRIIARKEAIIGKNSEAEQVIARKIIVKKGAEVDHIKAYEAVIEKDSDIGILEYVNTAQIDNKASVDKLTKIKHIEELEQQNTNKQQGEENNKKDNR